MKPNVETIRNRNRQYATSLYGAVKELNSLLRSAPPGIRVEFQIVKHQKLSERENRTQLLCEIYEHL